MDKKSTRKEKVKKEKDQNKPKRPISAYFYFLADAREEAKQNGTAPASVSEQGAKWKSMDSKERKTFDDLAAKDKARWERETAKYKGDPADAKPKKPLTAYFLFLADFRKKHTGKMLPKDIMVNAGAEWRGLTDTQKKPYAKQFQQNTVKYLQEKEDYEKKQTEKGPVAKARKQRVPEPEEEENESDDDEAEEADDDEEGEESDE